MQKESFQDFIERTQQYMSKKYNDFHYYYRVMLWSREEEYWCVCVYKMDKKGKTIFVEHYRFCNDISLSSIMNTLQGYPCVAQGVYFTEWEELFKFRKQLNNMEEYVV